MNGNEPARMRVATIASLPASNRPAPCTPIGSIAGFAG